MNTYDIFNGLWTYRSLINNPDMNVDFNSLEFGRANLLIAVSNTGVVSGRIFDTGWELTLKGSAQLGTPGNLWLQGSGIIGGAHWVYDYLGYAVPEIPNGVNQVRALVGSVIRTIDHPNGSGGTSKAGVVCSFYAVRQ